MGFDPCNLGLKIWESIWDSNSYNGSSLGSVRVHSLTLFALSGACDVTPKSFSWPATLQPFASVENPKLGLRHLYIMGFLGYLMESLINVCLNLDQINNIINKHFIPYWTSGVPPNTWPLANSWLSHENNLCLAQLVGSVYSLIDLVLCSPSGTKCL
jgi:hypothetical protein